MGRRRIGAVLALGLLQVVVVISLALAAPSDHPHEAPVRLVAPPVVATAMIARTNSDRALEARVLATAEEARDSVRAGHSVAAVVVDLRGEQDTLYVAGANGSALNRDLRERVERIERSFGRDVVVRDLVPARAGDADHRGVYVIAALCSVLGFVVALVVTWLRGPMEQTLVLGARRVAASAAVALTLGGLVGAGASLRYDEGFLMWWAIAALTVLVGTLTTLALESVFGVLGIGVATTLFVLAAAPLVRLTHPLLLPEPWATITPWLPHGAALDAGTAQAYFGGPELRSLLIAIVWTMLSILTMIVARRERARRFGAAPRQP
ncbi:hypothetical protein [Aeromicrobium sp.]|uniref:hypothetical protein n=1 Tax=Aeromicrobium sp. TaxID=1871063 RepID=UPI002FCA1E5E